MKNKNSKKENDKTKLQEPKEKKEKRKSTRSLEEKAERKRQRELEKMQKEIEYEARIENIKKNAPEYIKLTLKENLKECSDELAFAEAKEFLSILHHKLPYLQSSSTNAYYTPKIAITQLMRDYGGAVLTRYYESAEELDKGWTESHNVYTSVHVHNQFKRTIATTTHLNALFADLDFYKTNEETTYEAVNAEINNLVQEQKLPEPTLRVNSGRGMQLYWVLDEYIPLQTKYTFTKTGKQNTQHISTYYTITYDLLQMHLGKVLSNFNSDPKALLRTQLLRLPGSRHGKNNNAVTFEHTGGYYSLEELHNFYYEEIEAARPLPPEEQCPPMASIENSHVVTVPNITSLYKC